MRNGCATGEALSAPLRRSTGDRLNFSSQKHDGNVRFSYKPFCQKYQYNTQVVYHLPITRMAKTDELTALLAQWSFTAFCLFVDEAKTCTVSETY